jgi:hypothetical protein
VQQIPFAANTSSSQTLPTDENVPPLEVFQAYVTNIMITTTYKKTINYGRHGCIKMLRVFEFNLSMQFAIYSTRL